MKLAPIRCEQAGRFRLQTQGKTRGYIDHGWQDNLILDAGIQRLLGTNGSVLIHISVGAGSTAPAVGQTQLVSKIAHTNRNQSFTHGYNSEGGFGWTKFTVQFDKGAAQGNVAELGVGWDGTNLWSRALVLNAQNEPTAITILADEYLTVTYELRSWWIVPENHYVDVMEDVGGTPTVIETVEVNYQGSRATIGAGAAALYNRSSGDNSVASRVNITTGDRVVFSWGTPSGGEVGFTVVVPVAAATAGVTGLYTAINNTAGVGLFVPAAAPTNCICTFTPAIPKTNEYEVTIEGVLSMGRKS